MAKKAERFGPLHGEATETGYVLPEGLTYEEWAAEGPILIRMAQSAMWWVGDWIRYGERRWGETYAQAIEVTGLAEGTLRNAVWVCDRIPPSERRADVPFSTHKAAAPLDSSPRGDILKRAASEGLSEYEVRAEVKRVKEEAAAAAKPPPPEPDPEPEPTDPDAGLTLAVVVESVVSELRAAETAGDWLAVARCRNRLERALRASREPAS